MTRCPRTSALGGVQCDLEAGHEGVHRHRIMPGFEAHIPEPSQAYLERDRDLDLVTPAEAARELGVSRQAVSQALGAPGAPEPEVWGRTVRLYSMPLLRTWWASPDRPRFRSPR